MQTSTTIPRRLPGQSAHYPAGSESPRVSESAAGLDSHCHCPTSPFFADGSLFVFLFMFFPFVWNEVDAGTWAFSFLKCVAWVSSGRGPGGGRNAQQRSGQRRLLEGCSQPGDPRPSGNRTRGSSPGGGEGARGGAGTTRALRGPQSRLRRTGPRG